MTALQGERDEASSIEGFRRRGAPPECDECRLRTLNEPAGRFTSTQAARAGIRSEILEARHTRSGVDRIWPAASRCCTADTYSGGGAQAKFSQRQTAQRRAPAFDCGE